MTSYIPRLAQDRLEEQLRVFRAVVVSGPRQAGKTTLLELRRDTQGGTYRSLDDPTWRAAATTDPTTFVTEGDRPLMIDEIQRGGDPLILGVKAAVDSDRAKGQFVLSGSSNFLAIPTLSESLAGRVGFVETWPLTMAERCRTPATFCDAVFEDAGVLSHWGTSPWTRVDYLDLVCAGGYPEAVELPTAGARRAWFDSYLRTVIERDVQEFARVQHATLLPRLVALVAARAGSTIVHADLASALELNADTIRGYLSYLDIVYLTFQIPAWSVNLTKKAAKTPKTFVADPGVAAHVLRVDVNALRTPGHPALGGLIETLVATELLRLRAAARTQFDLRYFRERDTREVDFVLEAWDGSVVAIEVKSSATATSADARHLIWLKEKLGDRMRAGIVLYLGTATVSLGDGILAAPVSALWGHQSEAER